MSMSGCDPANEDHGEGGKKPHTSAVKSLPNIVQSRGYTWFILTAIKYVNS